MIADNQSLFNQQIFYFRFTPYTAVRCTHVREAEFIIIAVCGFYLSAWQILLFRLPLFGSSGIASLPSTELVMSETSGKIEPVSETVACGYILHVLSLMGENVVFASGLGR